MRRAGETWAKGVSALVVCTAFSACSYDFDGLIAPGGGAGNGGSSGAAGSGAAGTAGNDGSAGTGGADGSADGWDASAGTGGSGKSGSDTGTADTGSAGADANAGDAGPDRLPDAVRDGRAEVGFDCAALSGTVFQGHCYYLSPALTNWETANMTGCGSPSHLAVITTAAEQGVVAAILPGNERWIGLRKNPGPPNNENAFHWVTGEGLSVRYWDSYEAGAPEPNYTGDCVRMRPSNNWGDTPCTDLYAAVCERE
jgi:hypothetical protein